jgi:ferric-dicitrate binding protein FerR (iron transport regulator)
VTTFRYAERASRLLRAARARIRPHRSAPPENAIAAIAEAIERTTSRQRRRRAAAAAGLATAILGAVALVAVAPWRSPGTIALVTTGEPANALRARLVSGSGARAMLASADGQVLPLPAGHAWVSDERLQTDALPATLAGEDGTTVELEPRSDLRLLRADAEQWLRLGRGAVALHVAKLKSGQRFVVLTPDAEVEVRGTRFHVALAAPDESCGRGTPTRVVVDEGVVVVRSASAEVRVSAGQRWPAACPVPRAAAEPTPPSVVTRRLPRPALATPASTLATENDLFGAALRAERSGDRAEAAQLLDALLRRFPHSPLRESAQRAQARVTATALSSP